MFINAVDKRNWTRVWIFDVDNILLSFWIKKEMHTVL